MARKSQARPPRKVVHLTPAVARVGGQGHDEHKAIHDKYVVYHAGCDGRHGTLMGVPVIELRAIEAAVAYLYGPKSGWKRFNDGPLSYDIEFVSQRDSYPPPRKPWELCGTTMLFKDWQQREADAHKATAQFKPGDKVTFTHTGSTYVGLVARVNAKRCTVVVEGLGSWYVPGKELRAAE